MTTEVEILQFLHYNCRKCRMWNIAKKFLEHYTFERKIVLLKKIRRVSSAATTGAQRSFDQAKQDYFRRIDAMNLRNPRMIGFGISNRQTLTSAMANASGAIIGSKFVTLLDQTGTPEEALSLLRAALEQ